MSQKPKRPKSFETVAPKRAFDSKANHLSEIIRFRFDQIDSGSPWDLEKIGQGDLSELLTFLRSISHSTIGELFHGNGPGKHYTDLHSGMSAPALRRLVELYSGQDYVHRLRLSGKKRLFGILVGSEFSILWWDPEHDVWPSKRR